ncbi:hypothetical protein ACP70R_023634 [Stipagrostis hirtigluma subsp. patula]
MAPLCSATAAVKPPGSASAIVADRAHGYHDLKIDSCLLDADDVPTGERLLSSPFTVGGHLWRVVYYPRGFPKADAYAWTERISFYLVLDEDVATPVRARFQFSFMVEGRPLFFLKWKKKTTRKTKVLYKSPDAESFGAYSGWGYTTSREPLAWLMRHYKSDHFTIRCDVVVVNGFRVEEAPPVVDFVAVPPSDLHEHLGDLLRTGRGADVVFEVGGETFAAHRCVLAARSPVISAELLAAAAATPGQSSDVGDTGVVRIDDVERRVFRALLRFAYTDSLPEMDKDEEDAMYRDLLAAADRYSLARLKLICEDKLCKRVDVGTVDAMLAIAEHHRCDGLKKACVDFLRGTRVRGH